MLGICGLGKKECKSKWNEFTSIPCTQRPGFSSYNWCHDFQCDFNGRRYDMVVTSVSGHIMELDFDAAHRKWSSCDPVALFEAPVRKQLNDNSKDMAKTLKREARSCQVLILWLDCDREGENIAFEVIDVCRVENRYIFKISFHFMFHSEFPSKLLIFSLIDDDDAHYASLIITDLASKCPY